MMQKDIDQLFKSKLGGYSTPPPPNAWGQVKAGIAKNKKGKKVFLLRMAGIAAALAIAAIFSVLIVDTDKQLPRGSDNKAIFNAGPSGNMEFGQEETKIPEPTVAKEKLVLVPTATLIALEDNTQSKGGLLAEEKNEEQQAINMREGAMAFVFLAPMIKASIAGSDFSEPIKMRKKAGTKLEILENERKIIALNALSNSREGENKAKWKLGILLSPEYSSQAVSHSEAYADNMTSNASEGSAKMGGGLSVKYKTNKKWSIESGVYYSQNGQRSGNPGELLASGTQFQTVESTYNSALVDVKKGSIQVNSSAGVIQLDETPADVQLYTSFSETSDKSVVLLSSMDYYQVFDFVEVPVYVRYQLLESQISVQLMGGVSTNFLVGNNVYLENGDPSKSIGKTKSISNVNYSGTFGVGLEYALGKHLSLSVEPRVNYYLSSINKSHDVNYHPYRVGVYTGLNYTF